MWQVIKKKFGLNRLKILKLLQYIYSEINEIPFLPTQTKTQLLINLISIQKTIDKKEIEVNEKLKSEINELMVKLNEPPKKINPITPKEQAHRSIYTNRPKIENQWFDTVKEAGAISTATPGFIPRPRYKKKKKWNIIKLTEDMQNRPPRSD